MTVSVVIQSPGAKLAGDLATPTQPDGVVVFAHGSGSSRHSPRNRVVAQVLRQRGFATLLLDLLTLDEEQVDLRTRQLRFDIALLAGRVTSAVAQIREHAPVQDLPVGLFGASACSWPHSTGSRWSTVPPTSSRSPAPWRRWHDWPPVGSTTISQRNEQRPRKAQG